MVTQWSDAAGRGFAEASEAPGGILIDFSVIEMEGFRTLDVGEVVQVALEGPTPAPGQDGWAWEATRVRRAT